MSEYIQIPKDAVEEKRLITTTDAQPGTRTAAVTVATADLNAALLTAGETAEYDDVWMHAHDEGVTLTDHETPMDGAAPAPANAGVDYCEVIRDPPETRALLSADVLQSVAQRMPETQEVQVWVDPADYGDGQSRPVVFAGGGEQLLVAPNIQPDKTPDAAAGQSTEVADAQ